MPRYDYACALHGAFEREVPMALATVRQRCPRCGNRCERAYLTPPAAKEVQHWERENGGRGRQITQISDTCYARSPTDVPELAKRAGFATIVRA